MHQISRSRRTLRLTILVAALAACTLSAPTTAARPPQLAVFSRHPAEARRLPAFDSEAAHSRQAFRKEPYLLFTGDPDAMDVHWQLHAAAPCTIDWGLDTGYSLGSEVTIEHGDDHQHTHKFTGLAPSTLYFYQVRSGGEAKPGSFRSPPAPDETRLKFFAYGDTRSFPEDHDAVAARMVDVFQADAEFQTLTLHVGDLVDNGELEEHWDEQFFDPVYADIAQLHANLPTQAARGNHERDAVLYAKYFPYPFVMSRAWSFDYGPAHFVVVDQYIGYGPSSQQLAWVENDLATTDRPWKFMVVHEPGWSAGGHENDPDVQGHLHPLCVRYGVRILFAGHNHYYARAIVDSVHHVTTGGGGAPLYAPDNQYPHLVAIAKDYHYCTIEIDGDSLTYATVNCLGETLDWFPRPATGVAEGLPEVSALHLDAPAPSPSASETQLSFTLSEPMRVELAVYDVGGRLVRSLLAKDFPVGEHSASWDGKSDAGERVASGVYFARLSGPRDSATRRIVRLR